MVITALFIGKFSFGLLILGQSNFGKYWVLIGSVFVRDIVYPDLPWNACLRCIIWWPFSVLYPFWKFFCTFQSIAALQQFSTARAPPATKNRWFMYSGFANLAKVSTDCANSFE